MELYPNLNKTGSDRMEMPGRTTKRVMYKNRLTMIHAAENHFKENDGKRELLKELGLLEKKMQEAVQSHQHIIQQLIPAQQSSCNNLLFYLALRSEDIRDLQNRLHVFGLSSLASSESHIYSQLNAILERLGKNVHPDKNLFCTYQDALNDILLRGGGHHIKKRYTFRPLNIAKSYLSSFVKTSD